MKNHAVGLCAGTLLMAGCLGGCASESKDIAAAYVSPIQYQHYTCLQIHQELARVSSRVHQLAGQVDDNATNDAVAMGVGLVLFWPALFFIDGDGPEAQEYARLQGERDALQQTAIQRNCGAAGYDARSVPTYQVPTYQTVPQTGPSASPGAVVPASPQSSPDVPATSTATAHPYSVVY